MAEKIMGEIMPGVDLRLHNISHRFDPRGADVLQQVSLDIARGQTTVLLGASGCGKTTLLRLIAGLEPLQSGTIERDGRLGDGLSFVFQSPALLPWSSARDNVQLPLALRGAVDGARVDAMLASVGLSDKAQLRPHQLSGGQQMRVSIARALASGCKAILLDEPFAALDEVTRQRLAEQLDALRRAHDLTAVFVTHNISEAVFLGQTIVLMGSNPGRVVSVHAVDGPADRTADFRGRPQYQAQCAAISQALSRHIAADA